jgi:hypothetical protein
MIELKSHKLFVEAAEAADFRKSSASTGVLQSMVSKKVRELPSASASRIAVMSEVQQVKPLRVFVSAVPVRSRTGIRTNSLKAGHRMITCMAMSRLKVPDLRNAK